jgi:hypothetical protein
MPRFAPEFCVTLRVIDSLIGDRWGSCGSSSGHSNMDLDSSKVGGDEPWIQLSGNTPDSREVGGLEETGSEKKSPSVHAATRTRSLDCNGNFV